jgi:hypothetical protein
MVGGAPAATGDSTLHARVLVFVKKSTPHRERNGASFKPKASTLPYALDTAVVVIDRMTAWWGNDDSGLAGDAGQPLYGATRLRKIRVRQVKHLLEGSLQSLSPDWPVLKYSPTP